MDDSRSLTEGSAHTEQRVVGAHLEALIDTASDIALAIAVAANASVSHEELTASVDGRPVDLTEISAPNHGRLHVSRDVRRGYLIVDYTATIDQGVEPALASEYETFQYVRPSRYCESDELGPFARSEFEGLTGADVLAAVSSWVGTNINYVPGSSRPTDGAVATLLAREGVCRDFAHLTTALLRANDIPARIVSVYAPGLFPMDFHAVTEACLEGRWYVVDPTCLAPRTSLLRIATGADASDIAFLSNTGGRVDLTGLWVTALADPVLPYDDVTQLVSLE